MSPRPDADSLTTILFDMDNTLFDLVGAQIAACRQVVRLFGYDDGQELFSYFLSPKHGFESPENIREYMTDHHIAGTKLFDDACRIYHAEKLRAITPYDNVHDTLKVLREQGFRMGIVTDAERKDALPRLEKCGLSLFFDSMMTFDMIKKKKPAPEPFLAALSAIGAGPRETLFVGDSPRRDIEPCRALGIRTVYARYGDRFSKTRGYAGADYSIDNMGDLPEIVGRFRMISR